MDNPSVNMEKLAAELAGNTLMDENMMNDQTHQQIIAFLKSDKVNTFRFVNNCVILLIDFPNCYSGL